MPRNSRIGIGLGCWAGQRPHLGACYVWRSGCDNGSLQAQRSCPATGRPEAPTPSLQVARLAREKEDLGRRIRSLEGQLAVAAAPHETESLATLQHHTLNVRSRNYELEQHLEARAASSPAAHENMQWLDRNHIKVWAAQQTPRAGMACGRQPQSALYIEHSPYIERGWPSQWEDEWY